MDRLEADQQLNVNDQLVSANGRARLVMQGDGNLVLYRTDDGRALWASDTPGQPVVYTVMQGDGNLVAYSADGQPYWSTGTDGHPGAQVVLQGDANLVVYDSASSPLWASNTVQPFGPVVVPGFRPSTHAPLFSNATGWPPGTELRVSVMGLPSVAVDATKSGLCGGMSFLTRDIVESGTPQLRGRTSTRIPLGLADHILARLVDSFSGPGIPARWLAAIQALDHDTVVWGPGLFHRTVNEVPGILAEVDAGRLCPIGIVLVHSYAPWAVFENHVVLVWGYEAHGDILTLRTYDSNFPGRDDILIQLDSSSPTLEDHHHQRHRPGREWHSHRYVARVLPATLCPQGPLACIHRQRGLGNQYQPSSNGARRPSDGSGGRLEHRIHDVDPGRSVPTR